MKKLYILALLLAATGLYAQAKFTRDSFFRAGRPFPENYKELVAGSKWLHIATYFEYHDKIVEENLTNNMKEPLCLFEHDKYYRRIKGHKIVTNADFSPVNMVYVDASTIIAEDEQLKGKDRKKYIIRELYRKLD